MVDNGRHMIGRLTGVVVDEDADGAVVIDVGGVGDELSGPLGTLGRTRGPGADDDRVTLHVHTHVREDAFVLYGFATASDRLAFRTLVTVTGIGPRLAIAILSQLPAPDLARIIQSRDSRTLVGVSGVGKKLAERILLELQDKLSFAIPSKVAASGTRADSAGRIAVQVVEGLTRMGFKPGEAERAVNSLGDDVELRPLDEVFRDALALLRR
jgi:Holliday junction DNA helicase RuvA